MLSLGRVEKHKQIDTSDHLYYNIVIPHKSGEILTRATYRKQNTQPILTNCENYHLSVVRFQISTNSIPIHICRPLTPNSNELIYNVSLRYNGEVQTVSLFLDPEYEATQNKYFMYTYTHMVEMLNTALFQAFSQFVNPGNPLPVGSNEPFMTYDAPTRLFTLHAETAFYEESVVNHIEIFFNSPLEQLFSGLPNIYYVNGFQGNTNLIAKYKIINKNDTNIVGDYVLMAQDYPILNTWNSFKSIQITSNLPITSEFIDNNYEDKQSENTSSRNVLKDYQVLYGGDVVARTTIDYKVDEYELIDMKGIDAIRNMEFDVIWIDNFGNQYPHYLKTGETVQIKLMFRKRYSSEY